MIGLNRADDPRGNGYLIGYRSKGLCLVVVLAHAGALGADEQSLLFVLIETDQPVAGQSAGSLVMTVGSPRAYSRVVAI